MGVGGTSQWKVCSLSPSTTLGLYFEVVNQVIMSQCAPCDLISSAAGPSVVQLANINVSVIMVGCLNEKVDDFVKAGQFVGALFCKHFALVQNKKVHPE